MSRKMTLFLRQSFDTGSYNSTLQIFLRKKRNKGLSEFTIQRYFFNLSPISDELGNPPTKTIKRDWLKRYVDRLWTRYARDTIRTAVGDIRHFFLWCEKKKHCKKNTAKFIKPISRKPHLVRKSKAAPEASILKILSFLTNQLDDLVYRDVFGILSINQDARWTDKQRFLLRDLFALVFLYETGARVGELSKLGAAVMNNATTEPASVYFVTVSGKYGAPDRYFTERTAEIWRLWSVVKPNALYAVPKWRDSVGQLKPHSISCVCLRRCTDVGVRPFRANALRHAKVKRSRTLVGLEMASLLVDHSDLDTTWGYANFDDIELEEAATVTGLQFDIWSS